MAFLLEELS